MEIFSHDKLLKFVCRPPQKPGCIVHVSIIIIIIIKYQPSDMSTLFYGGTFLLATAS